MLQYLWSHWIFVAFLAPFLWALVNIIDIYFVSGVYKDEWDGVIINSLFQLLPWLLPLFGLVTFVFPGWSAAGIAFLSGAFLVLSYYFYFKTLFVSNDMVVVQALANLSVPLVPFLAWFLVGEQLSFIHYVGIAIAFTGAMLFSFQGEIKEKSFGRVFTLMTGAFVFLALSMVFQTMAFQATGNDFWSCFLLFSTGATVVGLSISLFDPKSIGERAKHIYQISKSFFSVFVLAEALNLLAVVALQRAIDLSPAVSFVAVIGSLAPVFVMLLSLVLVLVFLKMNKEKAHQIYRDQLVAFKTKILACCIIALGIYLIS
jgi:uncharacterized membrane protein